MARALLEIISFADDGPVRGVSLPTLLAQEALRRIAPPERTGQDSLIALQMASELLAAGPRPAQDYAERLLAQGLPVASLLRRHLPAAIEIIGEGWVDDRLSFVDVAHASGNLMSVIRDSIPAPDLAHTAARPPRILLARVAGESHVLGLLLLAKDLRRRGWLVSLDLSGDIDAAAGLIRQAPFDAVGFSAACPGRLNALAAWTARARIVAPDALLMIGGGIADRAPRACRALGPDLLVGRHDDVAALLAEHMAVPA